jgi:hypothetical protein
VSKRKQRLGVTRPADGRLGQGGRARHALGGPHGDSYEDRYDEDREYRRTRGGARDDSYKDRYDEDRKHRRAFAALSRRAPDAGAV